MDPTDQEPKRPWVFRMLSSGFAIVVACVVVMWFVEIVDSLVLDDRLQRNGIRPRSLSGLDGIVWTPWLHSDFGHLASNSVPFIVLGWFVSLRGLRYWLVVTIAVAVVGGALTWVLAGGTNHIGASGVVFGYFGALLGGALYDRRPVLLAPALVALFLYGSFFAGVVPQPEISWEGHLFGMIAGFLAARQMAAPPPRPTEEDGPLYPWELDEPWLE